MTQLLDSTEDSDRKDDDALNAAPSQAPSQASMEEEVEAMKKRQRFKSPPLIGPSASAAEPVMQMKYQERALQASWSLGYDKEKTQLTRRKQATQSKSQPGQPQSKSMPFKPHQALRQAERQAPFPPLMPAVITVPDSAEMAAAAAAAWQTADAFSKDSLSWVQAAAAPVEGQTEPEPQPEFSGVPKRARQQMEAPSPVRAPSPLPYPPLPPPPCPDNFTKDQVEQYCSQWSTNSQTSKHY